MFPGFIIPLWIFLVAGIIAVSRAAERNARNKKRAAEYAAAAAAAQKSGGAAPGAGSKNAGTGPDHGTAYKALDREFHSLEFHDEDDDDCYAAFDESRAQSDDASAGQPGDISHMFPGTNDLVRGVVWAEILNNKNIKRNGEEDYDTAADTGACL